MKDIDLERELRQSLQRVEPDKDFSALAYGALYSKSHMNMWRESRSMMALAAALVLMLSVPVGLLQYQARQRRGEEAREQLVTALRIAGSKLQKTRQTVVRELNKRN